MDVGDILAKLENNETAVALLPVIQPFIPVLARFGKDEVTNKFIDLLVEKDWTAIHDMCWPKMTEDERDAASTQALEDAQKTVDRLHVADKFLRAAAMKILLMALKM